MTCSRCGAPMGPVDRFCEGCGAAQWLSSAAAAGSCVSCGGAFGPEGYCDGCGRRGGAGLDHAELDLGQLAAVTDRGHRRARNEDAVAVAVLGSTLVSVLCDGVSTSPRADVAATTAADTAIEALLTDLAGGATTERATAVAFQAALRAVAALVGPGPRDDSPSCTYVSAVVGDGTVVVGWAGDSRAYWVTDAGAQCLTADDALPTNGALTRWVGADAGAVEVRVQALHPTTPGSVVVCSDGLSRYLRKPGDLTADLADSPLATARRLTRFALDAGGGDNIAVAVLPFRPVDQTGVPNR